MEKLNIAEILRHCPKGMELDCTMFDGLEFDSIVDNSFLPIRCRILNPNGNGYNIYNFTKYGCWNTFELAKCVIFPKGKTTWEGFQRPFKDGDIVFYNDTIAIFKEWEDKTLFKTYVTKYLCCDSLIDINIALFGIRVRKEIRFATEEEKQKLFKAIKDNGYKWNSETKILEKLIVPKFKVGDRVKHISATMSVIVVKVDDKGYYINYPKGNGIRYISFTLEKDYELLPNKFDITTLKPFESRVLVRDVDHNEWEGAIFGRYDGKAFFTIGGLDWRYCIPYEGNEHLLGTTDNCDNYFKTWE